jgi:hypothetical protein
MPRACGRKTTKPSTGLSRAKAEYFYDPVKQATANPGVLVTDTSALDTLRKLRNRMHKSGTLWSNLGYIPVTASSQPGSRVELYFVDVTPVEN